MSDIAVVLDCDGTIIAKDKDGKTLLENLLIDYTKQRPFKKKLNLFFKSRIIKSYMILTAFLSKFFDASEYTGETSALKLCDLLLLKEADMPFSYVQEKAREYAKLIEERHRRAIKNFDGDVYIISSEPEQLLQEVVKAAAIESFVTGIYGTRFKIEKEKIIGFEKKSLSGGITNKYRGVQNVVSKDYKTIHAIGDSNADIGLFEEHSGELVPYTFSDSPDKIKDYVSTHNGKVVGSIDEFFKEVKAK